MSPDLTKILLMFDGKSHEAGHWLNTLCGVTTIHRWPESLKLEVVRVNLDGHASQWYTDRKCNSIVRIRKTNLKQLLSEM